MRSDVECEQKIEVGPLATGTNGRKIASLVRKCRAEGRVPAVFQNPAANHTFVY